MSLAGPHRVVLDTNWVLDLLVFRDPRTALFAQHLQAGQIAWLACPPMEQELERVLGYPALQRPLATRRLAVPDVLHAYRQHSQRMAVAQACGLRCSDPDDQPFIDLAVAHRAVLLSKDRAVLQLAARMVLHGANAQALWR
jgi:putative PIN family toxin of toxin-antitoxin system